MCTLGRSSYLCAWRWRIPRRSNKGYVRGFNVRTGKRLWIFYTIERTRTTMPQNDPGKFSRHQRAHLLPEIRFESQNSHLKEGQ